jgi:hypothetical protein
MFAGSCRGYTLVLFWLRLALVEAQGIDTLVGFSTQG